MCGRYYVNNETAIEIRKLVGQIDEKLHSKTAASLKRIRDTDIHPSEEAPVILASEGGIICVWLRWGFAMPHGERKGLLINARCESVMEKPLFREGIRHRRIAVPATAFYEWDKNRTKYTFRNETQNALFLAGCCKHYDDGEHFVILTTSANSSMSPVHDRMPLLLKEEEVPDWILNSDMTEKILRQSPFPLIRSTDYEQLSFF